MDSWKAEVRRVRREKIRRKKMQVREKVGTSWNTESRETLCFSNDCGSGGSKSRLAKAAGAEPAGQMSDEKFHAVVARSTFPSQNVQSTPGSDLFWKLRCRKSARRCGAKQTSKSKCTKHTMLGPLLEVEMSKKVHAVVARSTFRSQNVQNTSVSDNRWKLRCRKSARRCGAKHIAKSKCTKHHMFAPLLEVRMSLRFTTLHYITLHYTPLHYTPLQYTTLHNTTTTQLHNHTPLHSTTLHYTKLHYTTLHYTTLHYTSLHYTTLHSTTTTTTTTQLHSTTRNYYTTLHSTTLHYTTLHYITLNDTAPQIDR